jgi:hypothetical protein
MGAESRAIACAHGTRATVEQYEALYREVLAGETERSRKAQPESATVAGTRPEPLTAPAPVRGDSSAGEVGAAQALEALLRWRAALLSGLSGLLAAGGIALVPIYSDSRPSLSWEWGLYITLVPVAALMAVWLMRRSLGGLRAGWAALTAPDGAAQRAAQSR